MVRAVDELVSGASVEGTVWYAAAPLELEQRTAVSVFAYSRPPYFRRVLRSLATNPESQRLPFYFFLDGGPRATERENIQAIKQCRLPHAHVLRRPRNFGVGLNVLRAKRLLFDVMGYDAVVHLEDDAVVSPHFLGLLLRLLRWATERYDNVGAVQCYDLCLMSSEEKRRRLSHVRPRCTTAPWFGYALTRGAWHEIRDLLFEYQQRFLVGRPYLQRDHHAILRFVRDLVERGPRPPQGSVAPRDPKARVGLLRRDLGSGQDTMTALAMWRVGLVRLCTVVSRGLYIGRVGAHSTEAQFRAVRFHEAELDVFEEDRTLSQFEIVL